MTKFTPETAAEAGRRGGSQMRRLTIARVERELGALVTIEDAKRRLNKLTIWSAAGFVPGAVGNTCVRACEVWIRAKEAEASFEAVAALEDAFKHLTAERDTLAAENVRLRAQLQLRGA